MLSGGNRAMFTTTVLAAMCALMPRADEDADNFAPGGPGGFLNSGFRGSDFRGGDCNDEDNTIYPGRAINTHGPAVDHNCNGIFGTDSQVQPP